MEQKVTITNDLGEKKEFDILFSFDSVETGKKHIVYTDYSKDYKGNINCYSGYYEGNQLLPVQSEKEIAFINETLKTLTTSLKYKYSKNNNE